MGFRRRHVPLALASLASLAIAHVVIGSVTGVLANADGSLSAHRTSGLEEMLLALSITLAVVVVAAMRLRLIAQRDTEHGSGGARPAIDHLAGYTARAVGLWARLFALVGGLFLFLEGGEAVSLGASPAGLAEGSLPESAVVLLAIASATLLVAATLALAGWCHCVLTKRLTRLTRGPHHAGGPSRTTLSATDVPRVSSRLASVSSGRSPPPHLVMPA